MYVQVQPSGRKRVTFDNVVLGFELEEVTVEQMTPTGSPEPFIGIRNNVHIIASLVLTR